MTAVYEFLSIKSKIDKCANLKKIIHTPDFKTLKWGKERFRDRSPHSLTQTLIL